MTQSDVGFAPADLTDDRKPGNWETRYPKDAIMSIRTEAFYLGVHLFLVLATIFLFALYSDPNANPQDHSPNRDNLHTLTWQQLLFGWLGGVLGGTLFSIKWLYHVVPKHTWNIDRRLWRFFTPHISGGLSTAFVILLGSGIISIIDQKAIASIWTCFGISFLVGYFSDSATAKLSEVAKTLFGTSNADNTHSNNNLHSNPSPPMNDYATHILAAFW